MKPRKAICVAPEEAWTPHSQSKLHKFMQDKYDPIDGKRDSQKVREVIELQRDSRKVKNLIEWQRYWIESQRIPTDAIEGRTSLEELGERWDKMSSSEHGLLLRQVNFEEYLLGYSSIGKSIGFVYQGDKYYNPTNLGKTWSKFSDEDKKKILRAYTWSFSYVYYDVVKQQDVTSTTFDAKYEMYEEFVEKNPGGHYPEPNYKACTGCGLYLGNSEEELSEELGEMCLKCFREQTDQTHYWYDIPPVLKKGEPQ